jgi:hypothetical protein
MPVSIRENVAVRNVIVEYLKQDPRNGNWLYRRVVPKVLKTWLKQGEFVKTLGKNRQEALIHYGPYHQQIEHMKSLAQLGVTGLSPTEQRERLSAMLQVWGAAPYSAGLDDNERTWRETAAAKLVDHYQDPVTGEYDGVPEEEAALARALLGGVSKKAPKVTITDAFKFYLVENPKSTHEKLKKQVQRFRRAEKNLLMVLGEDKTITDLTREDARNWRDMRVSAGVKATTIRREKNDISAVISMAHSELDAGGTNPFQALKMPKADISRREQREALPLEVIEGGYELLRQDRPELLHIWTLLDLTGCCIDRLRSPRKADPRCVREDRLALDQKRHPLEILP